MEDVGQSSKWGTNSPEIGNFMKTWSDHERLIDTILREQENEAIVIHLKDVVAEKEMNISFLCEVVGPDLVSTWYKNGQKIVAGGRIQIHVLDEFLHKLQIINVETCDQGVYTIICKNSKNCLISQATLYVSGSRNELFDKQPGILYLPLSDLRVTQHLTNVRVTKGSSFSLTAQFETEDENIRYIWFKNDVNIKKLTSHYQVEDKNTYSPKLSLQEAEVSDSGIYVLVAVTSDGMLSSIAEVVIMDEELLLTDKTCPTFVEPLPKVVRAYENENFQLKCKIEKDEIVRAWWLKDNEKVMEDDKHVFENYGRKAVGLKIINATRNDAGQYSLFMQNVTDGKGLRSNCFASIMRTGPTDLRQIEVKRSLKTTISTIGCGACLSCSFDISENNYYFVVWHVGLLKLRRSSSEIQLLCNGGDFLIHIRQIEPDMLGEVTCELRYALPNRKSLLVSSTSAFLVHVPARFIKNELLVFSNINNVKIFTQMHCTQSFSLWLKDSAYGHDEDSGDSNSSVSSGRRNPSLSSQVSDETTSDNNHGNNELAREELFRKLSLLCNSPAGDGSNQKGDEDIKSVTAQQTTQDTIDMDNVFRDSDPSVDPSVRGDTAVASTSSVITCAEADKGKLDYENQSIMEVIYCRLEDEGVCFVSLDECEANNPCLTVKVCETMVKILKPGGKYDDQPFTKLIWNRGKPLPKENWYTIEVAQTDGNYVTAGFTKQPFIEIRHTIPRVLARIKISISNNIENVTQSYISLDPKEVPCAASPRCELVYSMRKFFELYSQEVDVLGAGAFGVVSVIYTNTGKRFAAKMIHVKSHEQYISALGEFEIMKKLKHPNCVQVVNAYSADNKFIIVMDYLWGGDLYQRVIREKEIKESVAVIYVRQICKGLEYLHRQKIVHLDIKLENVVCTNQNSRLIKIIDFGISREFQNQRRLGIQGSRAYVAPESLNFEKMTASTDMWSLGVLTYVALSGYAPFSNSMGWTYQVSNIKQGNFHYNRPVFQNVSKRAIDFINRLLVKTPSRRLTASMALKHDWLVKGAPARPVVGPTNRWRTNLDIYHDTYKQGGNDISAAP